LLVVFVAGDARCARVKEWFAVHQKSIQVMAVSELHLEEPTTVNPSLHRMRSGVPVVEISDQGNGCCSRGDAIEVDRLGRVSGAITIDARFGRCRIHSGLVGMCFCDLLGRTRCLMICVFWFGGLGPATGLRRGSRRAEGRRA